MKFLIFIHLLWYQILLKIFGFYQVSVAISRIGFSYGNKLRYKFYKTYLKSLGENVLFSYGTILTHSNISIGNNVRFGPYNTIAFVDIGNDVMTGQFVHFMSGSAQHGYESRDIPMRCQKGVLTKITIEDDIWIGCNSVVMADISCGAVVGAGSVVTKRVDSYKIVGGVPAKVIKER